MIMEQGPGCSLLAVRGSSKGALLASNSDDPWDVRTRLVVGRGPTGLKYVGTELLCPESTVPWANMITRSLNEAGFGYTWAYVQPEDGDYRNRPGMTFEQWGQVLAGEVRSVDEALERLQSTERAFHGNFLMADRSGRVVRAEVSTRAVSVTEVSAVGVTNHYVTAELAPSQAEPRPSSTCRLDVAMAWAAEAAGRPSVALLQEALRDHQGMQEPEGPAGHSVCNHGAKGGTVSSEVIDLEAGVFWYTFGMPCGNAQQGSSHHFPATPWGHYLPFRLAELEPGVYTTLDGLLTPLCLGYLARNLSHLA